MPDSGTDTISTSTGDYFVPTDPMDLLMCDSCQ